MNPAPRLEIGSTLEIASRKTKLQFTKKQFNYMGRYYTGDIEGKFWFAVQSSEDARNFGGTSHYVFLEDDVHEENPIEIEFQFTRNDMKSIKLGIKECEEELGKLKSMLDHFFKKESGYNIPQMCKYLECDEDKTEMLLEKYARLELGVKIKACVEEKGQCCFSGEF